LVADKFYDPTFKGHDWPALVETHREQILRQADRLQFAEAVNEMLHALKTSGLGLISEQTKITSKNSISATFHQAETEYGQRWVFQDVHAGGPAAQASIEPGDVSISIGGTEIFAPADKPLFAMGQSHDLVVGRANGTASVRLTAPAAKHRGNPCAEPDMISVEFRNGVAVAKVPLFPGKLGIDFAAKISEVFDTTLATAERLVLDLRGNPGGGVGCLRLMSVLTAGRRPVGFSVDRATKVRGYDREQFPRFDRIPNSKLAVPWLAARFLGKKSVVLATEGLGPRPFQNRVVVLVNQHTTCASEMVALFAREELGAKIIGTETPGRLVSHSGFKLGNGFTLALPVAAYVSWGGTSLDGVGLKPDVIADWSYAYACNRIDSQLEQAKTVATQLHRSLASVHK
jgi:C-terminal processing protease CtpA/Prc